MQDILGRDLGWNFYWTSLTFISDTKTSGFSVYLHLLYFALYVFNRTFEIFTIRNSRRSLWRVKKSVKMCFRDHLDLQICFDVPSVPKKIQP